MSAVPPELTRVDCEVRCDDLTRRLYATDASLYSIEPRGVAFPRNAEQARAIICAAAHAGVAVIPRGAGSGLVGGAIGDGIVIDFARHNARIDQLDLDRRTVRVGPGVVLDQLNAFLRPHGFCFGPDVATSSRATIGGMIANNSSGARTPVYGTTADHVLSLEIVLADGRLGQLAGEAFQQEAKLAEALSRNFRADILREMPTGLQKRWPGYGLDRFLREPKLTNIIAGSEGTLAGITAAELQIVLLPKAKALALLFFASVAEAMQATIELLDLKPAAIEHIDHVLTDQTRGQMEFKAARDLLELDTHPAPSILLVEFYDDPAEKCAVLARRSLGLRKKFLHSAAEMNLVWALRKAGVALLTGCKGRAKPVTCIEDTAVRPEQLPDYVAGLQSILRPLNVQACFYGHAASGLLHVRPVLDLHTLEDRRKFRQISGEVSALVRQFKGSIAAEHGVGIARTEYLREHLSDSLLGAMRAIKDAFDPKNIFNPGKIFDDSRYRIDRHLRADETAKLSVSFQPQLAFARKDESFLANLEQCNGCGGCRKATPTMCPTFVVSGEEALSTRGRANVIRAALRGRFDGDPLAAAELQEVLESCLGCKACATECPSNVNLALLKAELRHAKQQREGMSARARLLSSIDLAGKLATIAPEFVNGLLASKFVREVLRRALGISDQRPLPRYAVERFDHWFVARRNGSSPRRGRVILWDDCFVRYHEPHIGQAALRVLEAAGFEVLLARGRECCGRPAFSQGNLAAARHCGEHNVALLSSSRLANTPVLFLEPSCHSMFADDYVELNIRGARALQQRSFLFEQFIHSVIERTPEALPLQRSATPIAIHAHCHTKALSRVEYLAQLAGRASSGHVKLLDTGCCGMAGAFGAVADTYRLSVDVAQPLVDAIRRQPAGTTILASGTSCRQQIQHLTSTRPRHMAEVLAEALATWP